MDSEAHKVLAQLVEHNSSMREVLKVLEEENKKLKDKIKLMDIYRSNNERMINMLKEHKDQQRALSLHIIDPKTNQPPNIGKKRKLEEGEGSNVSTDEGEKKKK